MQLWKKLCGEWKSLGAGTQRHGEERKVKKLFLSGGITDGPHQLTNPPSTIHCWQFNWEWWAPAGGAHTRSTHGRQRTESWPGLRLWNSVFFNGFNLSSSDAHSATQWEDKQRLQTDTETLEVQQRRRESSVQHQAKIKTSKQFPTRWSWTSARQQANQSNTARPDAVNRPITCRVNLKTLPLVQIDMRHKNKRNNKPKVNWQLK